MNENLPVSVKTFGEILDIIVNNLNEEHKQTVDYIDEISNQTKNAMDIINCNFKRLEEVIKRHDEKINTLEAITDGSL